MNRDLDEVLESQEKMLKRLGRAAAPREQLKKSFGIHLERLFQWLPTQTHLQVLQVSYNNLINDSKTEVDRIALFLDEIPAREEMLTAIDPALYRNRKPDS